MSTTTTTTTTTNKQLSTQQQLPPGASDQIDMSKSPYERYYINTNAPKNSTIRHIISLLVLASIGSLYYIIPLSYIISIFGSIYYRDTYCIISLITLITLSVIPLSNNNTTRNHWILRTMAEYFNLRWIYSTPQNTFDPNATYMGLWFPHGIIPFGGLAAGSMFDTVTPGYYGRVAMQPILFKMPLLRQLFSWYHGTTNDRNTLTHLLSNGTSCSIWPGGIAELFLSSPHNEILYIRSRKGFAKLALQTGVTIVPYYVFGNNHMFNSINDDSGKDNMLSRISRKLGASIVLFWGRYYLPIPYNTQVTIVRGPAIKAEKIDKPTQQQIDELHSRVVNAVQNIFDTYKNIAGHEHANKTLIMK